MYNYNIKSFQTKPAAAVGTVWPVVSGIEQYHSHLLGHVHPNDGGDNTFDPAPNFSFIQHSCVDL